MKTPLLALALMTLLFQTGCVIGRRTIALSIPAFAAPDMSRGRLCITSVDDRRVFENEPKKPSTPSIDGGVRPLSGGQKPFLIGRQRNMYGGAMGDIGLPPGDSVAKRTGLLLEQGLKRRGYQISSDASAPISASVVIDEFWAWCTPGFWSVSFEARVYCTITLRKAAGSSTVVVKGYGINRAQVARDANWQLAYDRAFHDFLTKLEAELDKTGF